MCINTEKNCKKFLSCCFDYLLFSSCFTWSTLKYEILIKSWNVAYDRNQDVKSSQIFYVTYFYLLFLLEIS
jgi:hypothetical protein